MKILILGANGYLGARIYLDLRNDFKTFGTYNKNQFYREFSRLNITDKNEVSDCFGKIHPDVIIHAANQANMKWSEMHPIEAKMINEIATEYIVDAANAINARLYYISSFAALSPSYPYAQMKKNSEEVVKRTHAGYIILQPSLIIGFSPNTQNDRPFNRILKALDTHAEAAFDSSWKFQPTFIGHITGAIRRLLTKKIINQIITVAVPEIKSRYRIAVDILSPFGILVKELDNGDRTPPLVDGLQKLKELNLPQYSYADIIGAIIDEIRHRERFVL